MYNLFLFCWLLITPVLYEGRYRPLETVPAGSSYTQLEVENYDNIAGTVYLEAAGKVLKYPTQSQLKAELFLHQIPLKWFIMAAYATALLLKNKLRLFFLLAGFSLHTFMLALRCYILLRPPVSNMSETILYVPWVAVLTGILFIKRKEIASAALLTALTLLLFLPSRVALENVQAVLDSQYWLSVHVLLVVGSYGILGLGGVCCHIFLFKSNSSPFFEKTILQMLYLGAAILICGTILGGVWAAESWGRFWDWDPKEAWAFISCGLYLVVIHAYRFKKIGGKGLAIGGIIGLMAITFTWYGVNYILGSGLHSYGFGHGGEIFYYLYLALEALLIAYFLLKIVIAKNCEIEKKGQSR